MDPWHERFCRAVARVLDNAAHVIEGGERVLRHPELLPTKGRDGRFAKVLTCAFVAAGEHPPGELFPYVRRAVDALSTKPPRNSSSGNALLAQVRQFSGPENNATTSAKPPGLRSSAVEEAHAPIL